METNEQALEALQWCYVHPVTVTFDDAPWGRRIRIFDMYTPEYKRLIAEGKDLSEAVQRAKENLVWL